GIQTERPQPLATARRPVAPATQRLATLRLAAGGRSFRSERPLAPKIANVQSSCHPVPGFTRISSSSSSPPIVPMAARDVRHAKSAAVSVACGTRHTVPVTAVSCIFGRKFCFGL
ncbi:hypothetical protein PF002_g32374, partial [Phytophthora fragariae]